MDKNPLNVELINIRILEKFLFEHFVKVRAIAQYKQTIPAIMKWVILAVGCCKCSIKADKAGKPFL